MNDKLSMHLTGTVDLGGGMTYHADALLDIDAAELREATDPKELLYGLWESLQAELELSKAEAVRRYGRRA